LQAAQKLMHLGYTNVKATKADSKSWKPRPIR
jgi:hypothetical protein